MRPRLSASRKTIVELARRVNVASKAGDLRGFKRAKAISMAFEGYEHQTIAKVFEVTPDSVGRWIQSFIVERFASLTPSASPGRPPKLSKSQKRTLCDAIKHGPAANGYPGACWRSPIVQDLIHKRFGVFYSVFYIAQLLKSLGFSYQKSRFASDHLDEVARQRWFDETWPKILKLSRRRHAHIFFGDEVSFPQWGSLSYTWAPRGEQPTVKTSGKRKGYKVFGMVEYWSGKFYSKALEERFTSETYAEFLREFMSKTRKHLIIVQDGARYHTSKYMRAFFERHNDRLSVFQLPSYSPDYNPIERLWKKIKECGIHMQYFPSFDALKSKVKEMLLRFTSVRAEILSLFGCYKRAENGAPSGAP